MRKLLMCIFAFIVLLGSVSQAHGNVKALIILPYNYGANFYLIADEFEKKGWDITTTALTAQVPPCPAFAQPFGCPSIDVDILISDIDDVTEFDCVLITSSTTVQYDPCSDLMASSDALTLIQNAVAANITIGAFCTGVRVLAAADVLDGVSVTGNPSYRSEYEAAGAIFAGVRVPPVTDGNIVTCVRGDFFAPQNCQAVADCVEICSQEREGASDE